MLRVEIVLGDITRVEADALVNAANDRLWMGSGVAGALKRHGGWEIEMEAINKGPVPAGGAVYTGAGRLKAKYVIHAVVMGQDLTTSAAYIEQATTNSLIIARELGIKSIAFPALGTGVGGFPVNECAVIMLRVVEQTAPSIPSLEKVIFALYGEENFQIFRREKERLFRE